MSRAGLGAGWLSSSLSHLCSCPQVAAWRLPLVLSMAVANVRLPSTAFVLLFFNYETLQIWIFVDFFVYCECPCVQIRMCHGSRVEVKGQLQESMLAFCHVGSEILTQMIMFDSKHF